MGNKIAVVYFEKTNLNLNDEFANLRKSIGLDIPDDNNIEYQRECDYVAAEFSGIWLNLYTTTVVDQRLNDFIKGAKLILQRNNVQIVGKNIFYLPI